MHGHYANNIGITCLALQDNTHIRSQSLQYAGIDGVLTSLPATYIGLDIDKRMDH